MIASHSNNFIFIKTRKTAGTSVEIVLSTWCSGDDVVTPIGPVDELIRVDLGGIPRNFGAPKDQESAYVAAIRRREFGDIERLNLQINRALRVDGFFNHMPATSVRAKLPELWERADKFTIERHPYEKVISRAYWWQHSRKDKRPIPDIIEDVIADPQLSCTHLYTERGKLLVDRVIRFDTLWQEIEELGRSHGKSLPDPLPKSKGSFRTDRRPARELLSSDQRRTIGERCAYEFDLLGFER